MLVVAASTKSAQLPFSSWLPRAMEGPTTSSAIFYGSLSVHLGVFLLIRTYP
jgi:NADH:ubiquinone oxidoreductase subunit 5 (subunit L)/multisubunit Na+/H+ antiporter MnhA subunit